MQAPHIPVMLAEVLSALSAKDGDTLLDGTFGNGGYSRGILDAADCTLYAIDRDPAAVATGEALAAENNRFHMLQGCFGDMASLLAEKNVDKLDGIALDIGVSSMQIDEAERGFSFRQDGPLDMRMSGAGRTAADIVNETEEDDLANLIYRYGEERKSRRVAKAIVMARKETRIERTGQLADIVRSAVGRSTDGIDPATRTFQAIRIAVNDELGELERALEGAEQLLAPGGRLAVVSFHSLEDRIVKTFLKKRAGKEARPSRHLPIMPQESADTSTFTLRSNRAIKPSATECKTNPRARSARLRVAERTAAPAHSAHTSSRGGQFS